MIPEEWPFTIPDKTEGFPIPLHRPEEIVMAIKRLSEDDKFLLFCILDEEHGYFKEKSYLQGYCHGTEVGYDRAWDYFKEYYFNNKK